MIMIIVEGIFRYELKRVSEKSPTLINCIWSVFQPLYRHYKDDEDDNEDNDSCMFATRNTSPSAHYLDP